MNYKVFVHCDYCDRTHPTVFANQSQQICAGCILGGPVVTVTVSDVIAAQGLRHPDVSTSQKVFRVATIIVTKDRPLNDDELALFDYFAARGEAIVPLPFSSGFEKGITKPFYLATRGKGLLITQLEFKAAPLDFDWDKKRDLAVYRSGAWFILRSSDGGVTETCDTKCFGVWRRAASTYDKRYRPLSVEVEFQAPCTTPAM